VYASEADTIIQHSLMCTVGITIQIGLRPVVRVSEVKTLAYFEVDKGDERVVTST
jgi:hypothetical protein